MVVVVFTLCFSLTNSPSPSSWWFLPSFSKKLLFLIGNLNYMVVVVVVAVVVFVFYICLVV
jgi:hypothetical protein